MKSSSTNASGIVSRTSIKNRKLLPAVVAGAVVLGGLLTWMLLRNRVPSPNADTVSVAKFVNKAQFGSLREEQQRTYLKALDKSKAQLAAAHESGQISDQEYQTALQNAWVGRIERQMDDYFAMADRARRVRFLDKIINQRQAALTATQPAGKQGHAEMLRKRMKVWPAEQLVRWDQFRNAVQERRKVRGLAPDPHMEISAEP